MKKWTASHMIALGVLGTDVLTTCWVLYVSRLAVRLNFTGSLPYLTALVGALQAATAVVLAAYFNKSRAENTRACCSSFTRWASMYRQFSSGKSHRRSRV